MLYSATKTAGLAAFKTCAVECARDGGKGSGVRFLGGFLAYAVFRVFEFCRVYSLQVDRGCADADRILPYLASTTCGNCLLPVFVAVCPGTIDTGFREKSTSAMKKGGKKDPLADAQSEKVGKVLSVQDSESLRCICSSCIFDG
jgi:hypothetical protein